MMEIEKKWRKGNLVEELLWLENQLKMIIFQLVKSTVSRKSDAFFWFLPQNYLSQDLEKTFQNRISYKNLTKYSQIRVNNRLQIETFKGKSC